jgi:RND superfamily putative drug exporter
VNAPGGVVRWICGRRGKWVVVSVWIIVLVIVTPLAQKLGDAEQNDASAWLPGSAESTQVLQLRKRFLPETAPAVVVYARPGGLTPADIAKIQRDTAAVRELSRFGILGGRTVGPVTDRPQAPRAAEVVVPIEIDPSGWETIADAVDEIRAVVARDTRGLAVHITGPGGFAADSADAFSGIDSQLLYSALAVVVVILLLTYRSPFLLLLPVVSVTTALFSAQAVVYLLATDAGLVVNAQSAGILTVLVFGAGTDYALLLVARYREELRRHEDRHEAMAIALHRAGPAVVASATTVALSMLCLLAAEMNSTSGLGPVAAVGIVIGLLAMITLFPALLVIVGRWVFWPVIPHLGSAEPTRSGVWARLGHRIDRRPRTVWVTTALVLAALSAGLVGLRASGLTNAESFTGTPDSVTGQRVAARYFPAGAGQPVTVIAGAEAAPRVAAAFRRVPGIVPATVGTPPGIPAQRGGLVYLEGTTLAPPDSESAKQTVDDARERLHAVPGADARVGGGTATMLDAQRASQRDSELLIPVILVVVLVILTVLLRALVAPLVLIATVVLSFAAALGVSAMVNRHVFGFAGEDPAFPLFVFVFLVALGIDYNIFLMTRVREEAARSGTRTGTLTALAATGGVITSAGLVLAGTFAALATLPVTGFAEIGFAVAFGVLLDTLVVRSVLVSALSLDLGRRMWWPSLLDRPVPGPPSPPPTGPAPPSPG